MADEEKKQLEEARRRPLAERVVNKLWKARVEAFEDMLSACEKVFNEEDPLLEEYGILLAKATTDANAAALDKALEALISYLNKCTVSHASKIASVSINGIVTKCLSGRPGTVQKSLEVCLGFVEAEQADKLIDIFTTKAFVHKVPKVVVASIDIILQAVGLFGHKVITPKELLRNLPPLFDSRDAKIRDKVKALVVEISRWVGAEIVKSILFEKMRDAMKEDVEKMIQEAPADKPQAQRFTKTDQAKMRAHEASAAGTGVGIENNATGANAEDDADAMEIDDYDLADPSEVIGELNKEWWGNLQEKKWSIRKGALTSLKQLASKPKLATGEYGDINRELKKIIAKDSNVQCVAEAVACVGALAKGLRINFASSAKSYCPLLLEKFKEKNPNVCRSCMEALVSLQKYCFQLIEVQEDIIAALGHQNPKVKQNTLEWMKTCIESTNKQIVAKMQPIFVTSVTKCTDDAEPATRDKALNVLLSFCVKAVSAAAVDKIMQKLDEPRQKKLNDMLNEARKGGNNTSANKPKISRVDNINKVPPILKKNPDNTENDQNVEAKEVPKDNNKAAAPPKAPTAKPKPIIRKPINKSERSQNISPQISMIEDDATLEGLGMTEEAVKEGYIALLGEAIITGLSSSAWKERLAALDSILEKIKELNMKEHGKLFVFGVSHIPGWTEKIFQVMARQFEILKYVAANSPTYSRTEAFASIKGLVEKMADIKLKGHAFETLSTICEVSGMQFVFTKTHERASAHKNPKVLAETLNWMGQAISEFGLGPWITVKTIIDWITTDLSNTNVAVKAAATALTGILHKFLGPALGDLIKSNVKPAQMTSIEAEFAKNPQDKAFTPTRFVKGFKIKKADRIDTNGKDNDDKMDVDGNTGANTAEEEEEAVAFNPDDLLPREDISGPITPMVTNLNSSNWKDRKAGMDEIEALLTSCGNRIQPNVGDLMPALKNRMTDTNKNLIAQAVKLLARICEAMGKAIDRQGRVALGAMLTGLCDNKPQVRSAVLELLESWANAAGVNSLLPEFVAAVSMPKCQVDGKKDALLWLTKKVTDGKIKGKESMDNLLLAAVAGLSDKVAQPREAGLNLLNELVNKYGQEVNMAAQSLDTSARKMILDSLQKKNESSSNNNNNSTNNNNTVPKPVTASTATEKKTKDDSRPSSQNGKRTPQMSPAPSSRSKSRAKDKNKVPQSNHNPTSSKGGSVVSDETALFIMSDQKDTRARKNRGKRPAFEGVAPDEPASLKSELEPLISSALVKLLFSTNFQDHISAAKMIKNNLLDLYEQIISCLDLIFRWCVLRIAQSNTQSLIATLDMLKSMFEKMASENYQLSEYEAVLLMPCVVEKMGHNQDKIKKDHREIIVLSTTIYPPQKIFIFVSDGLMSKNNKTRVECAEELGCMIDRDGIKIASGSKQSKTLSILAKCVSERDKALRQACLGALEIVYDFEGPKIWNNLGKLNDQQKSIIEERFKYREKLLEKKGERPGYRGSRPPSPSPLTIGMQKAALGTERVPTFEMRAQQKFLRGEKGVHDVDIEMQSSGSISHSRTSSIPTSPQHIDAVKNIVKQPQIPSSPTVTIKPMTSSCLQKPKPVFQPNLNVPNLTSMSPPPSRVPVSTSSTVQENAPTEPLRSDAEIEEIWSRAMITTQSEDPEEAIESLKVLCYELIEAYKGKASAATMLLLEDSADELVKELTTKMDKLFAETINTTMDGREPPSNRGCKYTLNTLMQIFNIKSMAKAVDKQTLLDMISCLLMLLLDDRMTRVLDGPQLMKAMNVLMMKVLDNAKLNFVIGVLMFLLRAPPIKIRSAGQEHENRFMNLVVKCLIKATKHMSFRLESEGNEEDIENDIDIRDILLNIHEFFYRMGPDEIRRRGEIDDKPLRMIKTILYEICKFKGINIASYLDGIPSDNPPPIILAYIDLNLESLKNSDYIQGPLPNLSHSNNNSAVISQYFGSIEALSPTPRKDTLNHSVSPDRSIGTVTPPLLEGTRPESTNNDILKTELASIFKKIGDKNTSKAGMEELYNFQHAHPEVDVQPFLSATSEAFRSYIDRGLQRIHERNAESIANAIENTIPQQPNEMDLDIDDDNDNDRTDISLAPPPPPPPPLPPHNQLQVSQNAKAIDHSQLQIQLYQQQQQKDNNNPISNVNSNRQYD